MRGVQGAGPAPAPAQDAGRNFRDFGHTHVERHACPRRLPSGACPRHLPLGHSETSLRLISSIVAESGKEYGPRSPLVWRNRSWYVSAISPDWPSPVALPSYDMLVPWAGGLRLACRGRVQAGESDLAARSRASPTSGTSAQCGAVGKFAVGCGRIAAAPRELGASGPERARPQSPASATPPLASRWGARRGANVSPAGPAVGRLRGTHQRSGYKATPQLGSLQH